LLKTGQTQSKNSEVISAHKSTVSRELKRNRDGRGYRPNQVFFGESFNVALTT